MLETIFQWIAEAIGGLLDNIISSIFCLLEMDLEVLAKDFPFFTTGYQMFQTIAIGIVLMIGVINLIRFFAGSIAEVSETPVQILVRSAIAAALIFFGGNFLVLIVDLCKIPFDGMVGADAYTNSGMTITGFSDLVSNFRGVKATIGKTQEVMLFEASPSIMLTAVILIMLLLGINLLKLMLEIMERYALIGVLAYSCPLFFATLASKNTSTTFKKWVEMFIGQCVLMIISAWMLKLILSGFSWTADQMANGGSWLFQLVLVLAMCKLAQRADTYMQQLGIGVGTTGGNLLDDAMGLAMMGRKNNGGGAPKDTKLGANADGGLFSGTVLGGIYGFAKKATKPYEDARNGAVRDAVNAFKNRKNGASGESAADAARRRVAGLGIQPQKQQGIAAGAAAYSANTGNKVDPATAARGENQRNRKSPTSSGGFKTNKDGSYALNDQKHPSLNQAALDAGIQAEVVDGQQILTSEDSAALSDFVSANYYEAGDSPEVTQTLVDTVGSDGFTSADAEASLVGSGYELSGNDQLGDALIQKTVDAKELTGSDSGAFTEVVAKTQDGDRVVSCNYQADGSPERTHMELHFFDPKTYTPEKSQGMKEYKTNTGRTYFAKSAEVKKDNFDAGEKK